MRAKILFFTICFALLVFSMAVWAQTNPPAIPNGSSESAQPSSDLAGDIAKVLNDCHINLSATNVTLILLALSKLAQVARKHWVQSDASVIGKITKLVAVDSHPPAAVTNPPVNPPKAP